MMTGNRREDKDTGDIRKEGSQMQSMLLLSGRGCLQSNCFQEHVCLEIIEQDVMGVSIKIRFYLYALAKTVRMIFSQALTFYLNVRKLCLTVTNQHNSSLCLFLGGQAEMFKLSDSAGSHWFKSGGKQNTFLKRLFC